PAIAGQSAALCRQRAGQRKGLRDRQDPAGANQGHQLGAIPSPNEASVEKIMDRFDRLRHANGSTPTAVLREKMQKAMQDDAAVFRTQGSLDNGCKRISAIWGELRDLKVFARSLSWNSDLVETLELETP